MCRALIAQGVDVTLATTDHDLPVATCEFLAATCQNGAAVRIEGNVPAATGNEQREGNEVLSGTTTPNPNLETRNHNGIPTIFFPWQFGTSYKYSRPFAQWLNKHVADFDLVHVHAVFNHASGAAARACLKHGVPYVVRPLGTLDPWSMRQKSFKKKMFWWLHGKRLLSSAAVIHYTTEGEKQATEQSLGLNHGAVVPLGVDSQNLGYDAALEAPRDPYVLFLSRLHPKKAVHVLVPAFLSAAKRVRDRNWRLVIAGDGPEDYYAQVKRLIESGSGHDQIVLKGWVKGETKRELLQQASVFALPSYQENFALCVVEAMSCGIPVVVSPQVNLASDIAAATAGWISDVNVDDLTRTLTEAMLSESERLKRGKNGKALARSFEWDQIGPKLVHMYELIHA